MRHAATAGIIALMLTLVPGLVFAERVIDDSTNTDYLAVISATSGSLDGDILTLNEVPNVVYFTDRPVRTAGHMSLSNFLEIWNKGLEALKVDPPNATLSILKTNGAENIVVELKNAEQKNGSLHFKVKVLEGNTAGSFETSTLFIDSFGPCPGC